MQRYTLKFNFQIKFYFFIENLCFCSLKIAVCAPKITIGRKKLKIHIYLKITAESKNCRLKIPVRLKITIISKNYRLKIAVRACMCTRVRVYDWGKQDQDQDRHTNGTQDTSGKGRTQAKRENLNIYVWLQAMKKKYKKS